MSIIGEIYPFLLLFFLLEGISYIGKGMNLFVNDRAGWPYIPHIAN